MQRQQPLSDEEKERRQILERLEKFKLDIPKFIESPQALIKQLNFSDITVDYKRTTDSVAYIMIPNTTYVYMKTLENMMYREVPTLAFDIVKENINTGVLLYDLLFKRIQNIPIRADNTQFKFLTDEQLILLADRPDIVSIPLEDEVITKYFDDQIVRFTFEAEGPEGIGIEEKDYYIKSDRLIYRPTPSQKEKGIEVSVENDIVITKLYKGQKIDLELYAVLGKGRDATKHVPVETVIWDYDPKTVKKRIITPAQSFFLEQKGDEQTIIDYDLGTTQFTANYHMRIESRGQMNAIDIVKQAMQIANVYITLPLTERREDVFHLHYF